MSASAAAKSFQPTGPEQAGRCWNGEANCFSSSASSGNSGSPVPSGGVDYALEAGQAVDDVDGVIGAALLAVVDDVDAGGLLLRRSHRRRPRAPRHRAPHDPRTPFFSASNCSTTFAGRGRLPVWVVRIRCVLRRIGCLSLIGPHLSKCARQPLDSAASSGQNSHCSAKRHDAGRKDVPSAWGGIMSSTGKRRGSGNTTHHPSKTSPATASFIAAPCSDAASLSPAR